MGPEIWIVVGIAALVLGPSQLPKLARSLGSAKKELQDGLDGKDKQDSPSDKPDSPSDKNDNRSA